MDEDQELLEGEIGFDAIDNERDEKQRDYYECEGDKGSNGGCIFVADDGFETLGDFFVVFVEVSFGSD